MFGKVKSKSKKRVGRGYGSGRGGHTVGRGQKGAKSRGRMHPLFEGAKTKKSYIQRLPLQRGKGKLKGKRLKLEQLDISSLDVLPDGSVVDLALLVKAGLVASEAKRCGVKVLGGGDISKKLEVRVSVSEAAARKIKAKGGKVVR